LAALWDFGLHPVAHYVVAPRPDGTRVTITGDLDLNATASLGNADGSFDLERLVALDPDLIVNDMWQYLADFWRFEPEMVEQIANTLFIDRPITETIASVEKLAAALGADLAAPQVVADKANCDEAITKLAEATASKPGLTVAFVFG
jgi:iron complex transport system substrate-binding protein